MLYVDVTGSDLDAVKGTDLFDRYRSWCDFEERRAHGSAKNFYARWEAHDEVAADVVAVERRRARFYVGIRFKPVTRTYALW